jgi:hypothetical protein
MFPLRLSALLFLYIPQFPAHCREYVGEIYELEYYYHPPILFLSSFSFSISFFHFFYFSVYYTNYYRWGLFVILSKFIHMRSCFEGFIKRNPMMQSKFNLVLIFLSYNIF